MSKTLVLFVYHIYNERVRHFIRRAIFPHPEIDFVIISNNGVPPPNVPAYVKKMVRPNIGYDFGGWSHALLSPNEAGQKYYEEYDRFIFVNSSVMGPFLRPGFSGKWTDVYLNGLVGNVKLFGSTINGMSDPVKYSHVQSYIFAMDKETLQHLIDCEIFSTTKYAKTFNEAILTKEIAMSRRVIENDWNIGCLMKRYQGVDFTFKSKPVSHYTINWNDVMCSPSYRNVEWNEYELVFIKGNRMEINSTEDFIKREREPSFIVNRTMSLFKPSNDIKKLSMSEMVNRLPRRKFKPIKLFVIAR